MDDTKDSLFAFCEWIKRRGPSFLDMFTATSDEQFETAFTGVLEEAVRHLETNKKNFQTLDEDALSAVLAGALRIPGWLAVRQESNSNGHVDLTIEALGCIPARVKLGEAKIYSGPAYHVKGMQQLLQRYTTGREGPGLVIAYVRKQDIKGLIEKLRSHLDTELPLAQQGACENHPLKWSLLTVHLHSSGESVQVGHIGCNLYLDGQKPPVNATVQSQEQPQLQG
jgi:hypothetical protein